MNLLGMYSDSEESDTERPSSPAAAERNRKATGGQINSDAVQPQQKASKPNTKKKRKKLDISFLPDNIQAALTRGGDDSSDDEEEYPNSKPSNLNSGSKFDAAKSSHVVTSALFNLLPTPIHPSATKRTDFTSDVAIPPKTLPKTIQKSVVLESESSSGDDSDSDSGSDFGGFPSQQHEKKTNLTSGPTSLPTPLKTSAPAINNPSPVPIVHKTAASPHLDTAAPFLVSASDHLKASSCLSSTAHCSAQQENFQSHQQSFHQQQHFQQHPQQNHYQSHPHQQQLQHQYQHQQYQQQQQVEYHQQPQGPTTAKSSRKRDRDIQNHLLNGDVAAAMGLGGGTMRELQQCSTWDDTRYREQKQRQQELQTMFGNPNGDKMVAQPTKNNSRKHQINSLMFSAAESELELLESRGRQSKSKAETQAKYGW